MREIIELESRRVASRKCPQCGRSGRAIDTQTVKAMLAVSLHAIRPVSYFFCPTEQCAVVYFTQDGEQRFGEEELRERVYQKHPDDDNVLICYCFRHTLGSIRAELRQTGQSTVIETVTAGTQTGQCACDLRNPQSTCCLGNLRRFIEQMKRETH